MEQPAMQKKLITFGPLHRLTRQGFLCVREGSYIYPPFYHLPSVDLLRQTWDTGPNDVFVSTHQKVGTHLTKKFVVDIVRNMSSYPSYHPLAEGDIGHGAVPWPEVLASQHGIEAFHTFLEATRDLPRIWYLHNYPDALPFRSIHPESKFIYTFRDPRGAAVSQYFFYKGHPNLEVDPELTLPDFVTLFTEGSLYFGDYHAHVIGWLRGANGQLDREQILCLRYEDLVLDKLTSTAAIASFLYPGRNMQEHAIQSIAKGTDFHSMKKGITENPGTFHFNPATFFRAGTTDDWKHHLAKEDQDRINQKTKTVWGGENPACPAVYYTLINQTNV